ncbi:MAG: tetratricopeptide repeat protein [Prevotella sp.]
MKIQIIILAFLLNAHSSSAQSFKELHDSLSYAIKQVELFPDSIDLRLRKAGWNIQLEQWQYALDEYDQVIKRQPANPAALFYRAFVNEKLRRYKFARRDYETLLKTIPDHLEASIGLALLNFKDNRKTEAFNIINRLAERYPDNAMVYAVRGGMELDSKMLEPAEFDYSRAIEIDSKNNDYLLNRVNIRIILGRKEDARADLDTLVKRGISRAELMDYYRKCK